MSDLTIGSLSALPTTEEEDGAINHVHDEIDIIINVVVPANPSNELVPGDVEDNDFMNEPYSNLMVIVLDKSEMLPEI